MPLAVSENFPEETSGTFFHHFWLILFSLTPGRKVGIIDEHRAAFMNHCVALDMKAREHGTRRKPGYPTPRNATLVEDHPPPGLSVRDQFLYYFSHYHLSLSDEPNRT